MRFPPRGTPLLRGTFVLPDPVEEEGRLVFREPLRDTLLPLVLLEFPMAAVLERLLNGIK